MQLSVCFDVQMTAFGDYQLEIYLAGLQGVLPSFPMAFAELEARAERALPPSVLSYVAGGAGSEHTQRANVAPTPTASPSAVPTASSTSCAASSPRRT